MTRRNIRVGADDTLCAHQRSVVAAFDILKADGRANHAIAGYLRLTDAGALGGGGNCM